MEGNRRNFLNKHSNPQFKRKVVHSKGLGHNSVGEKSSESSYSSETVYRILCQSQKIGSVIGKGGNIVKALREETQAKITVFECVPGSDERVIVISSPSDNKAKRKNHSNGGETKTETENNGMHPHCVAQDALLKVHGRIIEEDIGGAENGDGTEITVTARLLVPSNMVGCLLGRKGDVIQRLRSETGANIRVLPADGLPPCALETDELVQISGKPSIAKRALYHVSTLLHQNPRKDQPPLGFPAPNSGRAFHAHGPALERMSFPRHAPWLQGHIDSHGIPPMLWTNLPSGHEFDSAPPYVREAPTEFAIKILCPAEKIGSVIGRGGCNVRHLERETGASIHVEDQSSKSDERLIHVSSLEVLSDQRSQSIDAILQLQNKMSEYSEKGTVVTRLLIPSSKVGCILGQGGHVINEMRKRTTADIRVFSKEDKPKCASHDEELVQISATFGVAKDALAEIASRLRTRWLRDASAKAESPPVRPDREFGHTGLRDGDLFESSAIGPGSFGKYEHTKYKSPSYLIPSRANGYLSANHPMEPNITNNMVDSFMRTEGSYASEIPGSMMKLQDWHYGGSDFGPPPERFDGTPSYHDFPSAGLRKPQRGAYEGYNAWHGAYTSMNVSYNHQYENSNPQQDTTYQNAYNAQGPYYNSNAQGSYQY